MDCNVFGGPSACKTLPSNSTLFSQCSMKDTKVDCAFYGPLVDEVFDSPVDELQTLLSKQDWAPSNDACPQCFEKTKAMYCTMATPRCGTVQLYTRAALLPVITKVVKAEQAGGDMIEAILDGLLNSLEAISAALPCREMCEELVATCGCSPSKNETFGKLFTFMKQAGLQVPSGMPTMLFDRMRDQPFCSIFRPRDALGFSGRCDTAFTLPSTQQQQQQGSGDAAAAVGAATCSDRGQWCRTVSVGGVPMPAGDGVLALVQSLVALQFTRAASLWLPDDNLGAEVIKSALQDPDSQKQLDQLTKTYVDNRVRVDAAQQQQGGRGGWGGGLSGVQVALVVVLSVLAGSVLTAAAMVTYRYLTAKQEERGYLELQSGQAFKPISPADVEL